MDRAFYLAVLTALIWGFAPAFEKFGLSGSIDPYLGVVIRTIPIAVIGLVGLTFMGRLPSIATFVFYSALKSGEASVVVPITATYPLVAFIVSMAFLGESFTWQKAVGILLVVGGVVMLR